MLALVQEARLLDSDIDRVTTVSALGTLSNQPQRNSNIVLDIVRHRRVDVIGIRDVGGDLSGGPQNSRGSITRSMQSGRAG
jgi:hypothetical protein